jgi:hypothetical protein
MRLKLGRAKRADKKPLDTGNKELVKDPEDRHDPWCSAKPLFTTRFCI